MSQKYKVTATFSGDVDPRDAREQFEQMYLNYGYELSPIPYTVTPSGCGTFTVSAMLRQRADENGGYLFKTDPDPLNLYLDHKPFGGHVNIDIPAGHDTERVGREIAKFITASEASDDAREAGRRITAWHASEAEYLAARRNRLAAEDKFCVQPRRAIESAYGIKPTAPTEEVESEPTPPNVKTRSGSAAEAWFNHTMTRLTDGDKADRARLSAIPKPKVNGVDWKTRVLDAWGAMAREFPILRVGETLEDEGANRLSIRGWRDSTTVVSWNDGEHLYVEVCIEDKDGNIALLGEGSSADHRKAFKQAAQEAMATLRRIGGER